MIDADYKIAEHLPESINKDPIPDLARVIDMALSDINPDLLLIYPAIDDLPEALIDHLAEQMHVDEYDDNSDLSVKRKQVKESFLLHKFKGTKYAVQRAVATVYQSAVVQEWPEYDGQPYHFRVTLITAPLDGATLINKMVRLINAYKNTRSWLDYVQFIRRCTGEAKFGANMSIVRQTCITFDLKQMLIAQKDIYFAGAVGTFRRDVIHGKLE